MDPWKLFDYPMTLSDVDIITPNKMENIFKKFGIQINKNCIGIFIPELGEKMHYLIYLRDCQMFKKIFTNIIKR